MLMNKRTPKRSTSLVSTLIRPIIDRRSVSPASSFSSSILARGMSEAMTPQKVPSHEKSNRRRIIDFTRRRTLAAPMTNNKENYRHSPATNKYFFHSNSNSNKKIDETSPSVMSHVPPSLSSSRCSPTKVHHRRTSLQMIRSYPTSPQSLDDLLCDQEVESYFYPSHSHREHIYINIPDPPYLQGTLC